MNPVSAQKSYYLNRSQSDVIVNTMLWSCALSPFPASPVENSWRSRRVNRNNGRELSEANGYLSSFETKIKHFDRI